MLEEISLRAPSVPCRNALEDPWQEPSQDMFTRSVSPEQAPDKATYLEIDFEKGDPVALKGEKLSPATLLAQLNKVPAVGQALAHNPVGSPLGSAALNSALRCACCPPQGK